MNNILRLLILNLLFISLTGCSSFFKTVYGVNDPKKIEQSKIIKLAKKYEIPSEDLFELDKSYLQFVYSKNNLDKDDIKYRRQPLQVMYYERTGELLSYHVNCLATGFPKLNWNIDNNFESFIPNQQAPLNQIFPPEELINFFNPINHKSDLDIKKYDYLIIVFWNDFMGKQSKHLIKTVKENVKLKKSHEKVKVIYVNNDNLFSN